MKIIAECFSIALAIFAGIVVLSSPAYWGLHFAFSDEHLFAVLYVIGINLLLGAGPCALNIFLYKRGYYLTSIAVALVVVLECLCIWFIPGLFESLT